MINYSFEVEKDTFVCVDYLFIENDFWQDQKSELEKNVDNDNGDYKGYIFNGGEQLEEGIQKDIILHFGKTNDLHLILKKEYRHLENKIYDFFNQKQTLFNG